MMTTSKRSNGDFARDLRHGILGRQVYGFKGSYELLRSMVLPNETLCAITFSSDTDHQLIVVTDRSQFDTLYNRFIAETRSPFLVWYAVHQGHLAEIV